MANLVDNQLPVKVLKNMAESSSVTESVSSSDSASMHAIQKDLKSGDCYWNFSKYAKKRADV